MNATLNTNSAYKSPIPWIAGCTACLLALLAGNYWSEPWLAGPAKAAASTCFIALAISRGATGSRFGIAILVGLVLSWFGDVFLLGRSEALFLAGLVSFLLGHLAYAAAFAVHGINPRWSAVAAIAIAPLIFVVLRWLLPHVDAAMKIPVIAYITVITAMVILAWGTKGRGGSWTIVIGALLFFISDLAVSRNRFVEPESLDWLWGLPMYYAGQLFLAYSAGSRNPRE